MGFTEGVNAPSMYVHQDKGILMSIHVDDPLMAFEIGRDGTTAYDWFFELLRDRYEIKTIQVLTPETEIDYCSLRIRMGNDGSIYIDNDACIDRILQDAGLADCNPNKRPIHRDQLKSAYEERLAGDELSPEDQTQYQHMVGELNWVAQTTHPPISVAVSLLGIALMRKLLRPVPRWPRQSSGISRSCKAED